LGCQLVDCFLTVHANLPFCFRGCGALNHEELPIRISSRADVGQIVVTDGVVEVLIELSDDDEGEEVHDHIDYREVGEQCHEVDQLDSNRVEGL